MAKSVAKPQAATVPPKKNNVKTNAPVATTIVDEAPESAVWGKVLLFSLIAVFVVMTVMSFSYGISGDEIDMNEYGKATLKFFTSGFDYNNTILNVPKEYNRDGMMIYYGVLFDLICAIVNKFSPLGEFTTRHILNAWAGFLAIYFAVKICIRCFGRQAAVLCTWLMFLAPFFLGHAMNNPKDIPFATAYIGAVWCIILFFDHLPKPKVKYYVYAILAIAAAINIRVAGILLIPYLYVFAALYYVVKRFFHGGEIQLKQWVLPLVIVSVIGYLAGSLFWPYGLQNPVSNPFTALDQMKSFPVTIGQLWEGTKVGSAELPGTYLIKSFIITNSYALLAGIVLMILFLWAARRSRQAAVIYFILFAGIFPVLYIMYSKANVYHLWRHVLFIFPPLAICSAGGWYFFSNWLQTRKFIYGMAIAGVLLLEPLAFIAMTFPNTICYFNAFVGGVKGAYTNYEVDYYYNSMKQDADYFKKHILPTIKPADTVIIGSNAAHILIQYFKEYKNVKILYVRYPERDQKPWDYSIFHIALVPEEEIRAKTWYPPTTLFKAEVDGCVLSALAKRPSYDDLKGFDALQRNQADSAMNYFTSYTKADPNNIEMLDYMSRVAHAMHRDDLAQQYTNKINELMAGAKWE
jgi:Dolichyl-phosphate-mannose-protein mannosyltransferase